MPVIKNTIDWIKTMLTKPVSELTTPELLEVITSPTECEVKRQWEVTNARRFHNGLESQRGLTDRLRQFLGDDFSLNYMATVSDAVSERLLYKQMLCTHANADSAAMAAELITQQDWFTEFWRGNRLGFHQSDIHEAAVSQGEYFGIIDFDADNNRARITPHKRYVSTTQGGDGSGVLMVYPQDDISQKPLYGLKVWQETESKRKISKLALYLPEQTMLFRQNSLGWGLVESTPNLNRAGEPLGIPVVHFKMPGLRPEAKRAWPVQRMLDKLIIDLAMESDQNAFRIYKFFGFKLEDNKGNPLKIEPGQAIGAPNKAPSDASFEAIEGSDLTPQNATIDSFILKLAQLTDTPASRFQYGKAIAAEGTLKQQEAPLLMKCERRAEGLAIAWQDAATIARRFHNTYADFSQSEFGLLDESVNFDFQWNEFYAETTADKLAEAQVDTAKLNDIVLKINSGFISKQQAAIEAGYTAEQFDAFMTQRSNEGADTNASLAKALTSGF